MVCSTPAGLGTPVGFLGVAMKNGMSLPLQKET
jgi:hypothetical protein